MLFLFASSANCYQIIPVVFAGNGDPQWVRLLQSSRS